MKRISVLVVDDSALIRDLMSKIIDAQEDMYVVGVAVDPFEAREKIKQLDPDVVTLDVELPRMNGLEFLERLMRLRPTPVVMVSSLTGAGAATTLRALELGAVDFVLKPNADVADGLVEMAADLTDKIRAAAAAVVKRYVDPVAKARRAPPPPSPAQSPARPTRCDDTILVIGASTGGTEALKDLLERVPRTAPPILVTQHMPPGFTRSFAERLDRLCEIDVCEATAGMRLLSGNAYIAPGSAHLLVARRGSVGYTALDDGQPPSTGGRRAVPVGRANVRQARHRRHPHGDGPRRHRGHGRVVCRRCLYHRPGRSDVRRLRHAQSRHRGRRGAQGRAVARDRRHHHAAPRNRALTILGNQPFGSVPAFSARRNSRQRASAPGKILRGSVS
jgi:two-component system chemotaxis response regulator CheB